MSDIFLLPLFRYEILGLSVNWQRVFRLPILFVKIRIISVQAGLEFLVHAVETGEYYGA